MKLYWSDLVSSCVINMISLQRTNSLVLSNLSTYHVSQSIIVLQERLLYRGLQFRGLANNNTVSDHYSIIFSFEGVFLVVNFTSINFDTIANSYSSRYSAKAVLTALTHEGGLGGRGRDGGWRGKKSVSFRFLMFSYGLWGFVSFCNYFFIFWRSDKTTHRQRDDQQTSRPKD